MERVGNRKEVKGREERDRKVEGRKRGKAMGKRGRKGGKERKEEGRRREGKEKEGKEGKGGDTYPRFLSVMTHVLHRLK